MTRGDQFALRSQPTSATFFSIESRARRSRARTRRPSATAVRCAGREELGVDAALHQMAGPAGGVFEQLGQSSALGAKRTVARL